MDVASREATFQVFLGRQDEPSSREINERKSQKGFCHFMIQACLLFVGFLGIPFVEGAFRTYSSGQCPKGSKYYALRLKSQNP